MYACVCFPISSFNTFTYLIPETLEKLVVLGSCVNAPINRRIQPGFVVSIQLNPEFTGKILPLDSIRDKELHIPDELWLTLDWISQYYITPLGRVLKTAVPNTFMDVYNPRNVQFVQITDVGKYELNNMGTNKPTQKHILSALSVIDKPIKVSELINFTSSPHAICRSLYKKGWVNIIKQPQKIDPSEIIAQKEPQDITLSKEQQYVFDKIINADKGFHPYLLHGVTGSGKTEVYLKLAQEIIRNKLSVLVLVPEISLTPQVARRFRQAFGHRVALWHSHMTKSEKGWTWKKLKQGDYSIVVGARSAIFAPLKNLGLIIIDEEQEASYKQGDPAPRYHARDVAIIRGKYAGAIVLLASATPSLESYYNTIQKKLTLLQLTKRYGKSIYPAVQLINMKQQPFEQGHPLISYDLINAIQKCIEKSEQIILLQNRRGFSVVQRCMDCGFIKNCQHCSIAMTYHKTDNQFHCHYCNFIEDKKIICDDCESENLECVGTGTQKVEDILEKQLPGVRILRMDMDTVRKKGSHEKILQKFSNAKADILLGTQMIAKGLDFENVTLVGIINSDSGLFFPDFRAGERVFQLIYQVAGRAGRREKPGRVIIQTYNPDDIYIQTASSLDTSKFYNIAMAQRQELNYPPFSRICRIIFSGYKKAIVLKVAEQIYKKIYGNKEYLILGPAPAPLEKIKNKWRVQLIIKTQKKQRGSIHTFIYKNIGFSIFERSWKGVRIQIDIDPISMM